MALVLYFSGTAIVAPFVARWPAPIWYAYAISGVVVASWLTTCRWKLTAGFFFGVRAGVSAWYFGGGAHWLHHDHIYKSSPRWLEWVVPMVLISCGALFLAKRERCPRLAFGAIAFSTSSVVAWSTAWHLCSSFLWTGNFDDFGRRLGAGIFVAATVSGAAFARTAGRSNLALCPSPPGGCAHPDRAVVCGRKLLSIE